MNLVCSKTTTYKLFQFAHECIYAITYWTHRALIISILQVYTLLHVCTGTCMYQLFFIFSISLIYFTSLSLCTDAIFHCLWVTTNNNYQVQIQARFTPLPPKKNKKHKKNRERERKKEKKDCPSRGNVCPFSWNVLLMSFNFYIF